MWEERRNNGIHADGTVISKGDLQILRPRRSLVIYSETAVSPWYQFSLQGDTS